MTAPVFAGDDCERRTIRTPACIWFGPNCQVRCEMVRECNGSLALRASQWAAKPDGWHPEHGIRISSWGELFAVIMALIRSWVALRVRSFRGVGELGR